MKITVDQHGETFRLMATNYGYTAPAGERLFRSPPHPDIAWVHESESSALKDAEKLQKYVDGLPVMKKRKK